MVPQSKGYQVLFGLRDVGNFGLIPLFFFVEPTMEMLEGHNIGTTCMIYLICY